MEDTGSIMPREKLLTQGTSSLTDIELLALSLRTGLQGEDMFTLAKEILQRFESLYGLLSTDYMDLSYAQGIGVAEYAQLKRIVELTRRYYNVRAIKERALLSPEMAHEFLRSQLSQEEYEIFLTIFMGSQHHVIKHSKLFSGTLNRVEVYPKEIVREAMKMNTSAAVLVHNHPSGHAEPSKADKLTTEHTVECHQFMDVRVLDHLVIGCEEYVSFAKCGWI